MSQPTPTQDLVAKDLHGYEWRFKHIFRGKNVVYICAIYLLMGNMLESYRHRRRKNYHIMRMWNSFLTPSNRLSLGQPRRHLLTTGWSTFVTSKRLVAGDSFVFLRYSLFCDFFSSYYCILSVTIWRATLNYRGDNEELRVGVRRLARQQSSMPPSVISSQSMHLGVLATASHAITTHTRFVVYYKPRYFYHAP